MAWRSSGTNNAEMVDKLKRFGVITSDHVEGGFRRVDRKFFVPTGNDSVAHSDQPLKEGNVHISAPHIYGSAMEALDLVPSSSISFLNIGSGTGYISCIVADILGPNSLNYGVELHDDVIEHCKASISKWKANSVEQNGRVSTIHFMDGTPNIQIIQGNGLNIEDSKGESLVGFDRIYIGAAVDKATFAGITKLLCPGGILVGPVEDELVKVVRVGSNSLEPEDSTMGDEEDNRSIPDSGLNDNEFTSQILSEVRFAPLVQHPHTKTVIPSNVWDPSVQRFYPSEFKHASIQVLMCSNSEIVQPLPKMPSPDERFNAAAMLPKALWLEILSYTHRKWFEPEQNETEYLKRRLREEKAKAAKAEKARREAEERCLAAERERAVYRLLARRWQSRLNSLLSQQGQQDENDRQRDHAAEGLSNLLELAGVRGSNIILNPDSRATLSGLRLLLQNIGGDDHDEDEEDSEGDDDGQDEQDVEEMEEDDEREEESHGEDEALLELLADDQESDSDDFVSVSEGDLLPGDGLASIPDDNDSVIMEDADNAIEKGRRLIDQPRTISVSSDDL